MSNTPSLQPIRIDFLPEKYREDSAKRRLHVWRLAVTALFVGLLLFASWRQRTVRLALEDDLAQVTAQYDAAEAQMQRLTELQGQLVKRQGEAELVTFLRHPWPRSQVLAMLVEPLPPSIRLNELHIADETLKQAAPSPTARGAAKKKAAAETPLDPAKQDLKALRDARERSVTVVTLHGVASDVASLHIYLGRLAQHRLVAQAEVKSIERGGESNSDSHFQARVELAAPYGHREGPTPAEDAAPPVAQRNASTTGQAAARRSSLGMDRS